MSCLSPSQHLFNSFIVDFDDIDPVPLQSNNNKHFIKNNLDSVPSQNKVLALPHAGDIDSLSDNDRAGAALGMTLSSALVRPHTAISSPSESASPLSPPNSDSPSSSNASPAVPPLSLDSAPQSSPSPASIPSASTPPAVVKSESASESLSTNSASMELGVPGQLPVGPGGIPPDLSRSQSAGKGGCWTCRIRRKKCDEIRVGDSCSTCIRLTIECLGWGPKRPAWMRDKQAVERYKAGIKEKLIREGKVRGQPRPQPNPQASTMSTPQRQLPGPSMSRGGGSPIGYPVAGSSYMTSGATSSTSAQAQHAHGQRYGPYPSPSAFGHPQLHPQFQTHLQAQQHTPPASMMFSSSPSTPSSTLSTLAGGTGMDYFALESQQLPGHQGPMRRATVSVPVSRHLHSSDRTLEQRRRAYLEHQSALHLQHQPTGVSYRGPAHAYGPTNEPFGNIDFPASALGGMSGLVSRVAGSASNAGSLEIHNMTMANAYTSSALTGSPLILPTDEAAFQGGEYVTGQQYQYANRPSRSGSGSTTSSTPSSNSHLQLASGIAHPARGVAPPSLNDALMDQSLVEPHIQYHFENVLPMQYVFSSEKAHGILQSLIALDPFGPVTNSSCALAALHNKTVRVAQGFDQPDNSTANQFYDRACWQLLDPSDQRSSIQNTGSSFEFPKAGFTEADALAAIQLIGFSLLKGGHGEWPMHLNTAREWLFRTGLSVEGDGNPRAEFAKMSETQKFTIRMVIWYDIFAAICLFQSPRFLALYRGLLTVDGSISNRNDGSSTSEPVSDVRMDGLMGCPDEILLILAETADLARWKREERLSGTLSTKELLRRGERIEQLLHEKNQAASAMQNEHMRPPRPSGEHNAPSLDAFSRSEQMSVVKPTTAAAGASEPTPASSMPTSMHAIINDHVETIHLPEYRTNLPVTENISTTSTKSSPKGSLGPSIAVPAYDPPQKSDQHGTSPDNIRSISDQISIVFRETAALLLQSVINDPCPGVSEIRYSLNRLFTTFQALPTTVDRALVLPFVLAGCLTDDESQATYIRSRLSDQDETFGNVRAARLLIETVWQTRKQNTITDWRDVMRDQLGIELLLV